MTREIKFRAWDEEKNAWCVDYEVYIRDNGSVWKNNNAPMDRLRHDLKVMQFTGLKDKNGKEIYEGDILSVPETGWAKVHNATVIFKDGGFLTDFMNDPITDKHEVIGNIWEHPELLT